MEKATKIMRRSIFTFLQNYQHFTSTPSLLAFPFAASTLLCQPLIISSSNLSELIQNRLLSVFLSAGFPPSSELTTLLHLKLSQTIIASLFTLPFTISFLLLAKASIITCIPLSHEKRALSHWISLFPPLLITQFCNSVIIISANATCCCILAIFFNFFALFRLSSTPLLLLSATGVVIYSIVLANAYVITNLALILSGVEKHGGFISILKACFLIWGRMVSALSLAVSTNIALIAIESLFQYRVVRAYYAQDMALNASMVLEGMFIAYLYGLVLVVDTIVVCVFLKSCKTECQFEKEGVFFHVIEIQGRGMNFSKLRG